MCEWLSYGEWCDVRLVCGGRAFSAHRAVLASVSTFLRRILLSCPTDETPTFIVLPDFDLEAMSSVLYYIYNGEVVVQKEKLETFLDIIKAMQIFVDSQYLPNHCDKLDFSNSHLCCQYETSVDKKKVFTLGLQDVKEQRYINLKKGKEIQDVLLQCSLSKPDCGDKLIRCQNPSREQNSALGNLKSPCGDRQRNSFLRDLFIETYPRNGNVNGRTAGVLAISNECYRAPASELLTNANAKHLSADDALLEPFIKTGEHISHSLSVFNPRKPRCSGDRFDNREKSNNLCDPVLSFYPVDSENNEQSHIDNDCDLKSRSLWVNHVPLQTDSLYQMSLQEQIWRKFGQPPLEFGAEPPMFKHMKSLQTCKSDLANSSSIEKNKDLEITTVTRGTILNQVMDSPWCPRIPINYKPFRRKVEASKCMPHINQNEVSANGHNDNNNNVSNGVKLDISKRVPISEVIEPSIVSPSLTSGRDDFKCAVCNQVFTSPESLSSHMRRHNTTARYSCGECGKTFSQLRNFKYHMSIHRGTREFAATCTVCGKYFNDRGYLSSHMKIHRNRKEYKCTLCPKSFNQRVAYNMHVRIHTGVKPHVCGECGKAFSRKMLLKQHQRTHSGERPYACPHCDKRFADRSNMTLHLRLHTGVKPFSCTLCPKSFTKKHHLKSHLNFHTGSKPYSCPRCKLAFTQSSNMRTHLKKCNAPDPGCPSQLPQTQ